VVGPPPPPPPPPENPVETEVETRDLIEGGIDAPDVVSQTSFRAGLINLDPGIVFEEDPLIDDPVTGVGNEDLWVGDEDDCDDDDTCEE